MNRFIEALECAFEDEDDFKVVYKNGEIVLIDTQSNLLSQDPFDMYVITLAKVVYG